MSKEREVLKKILATGWLDHNLSNEVEELLAQPEQDLEVLKKDWVNFGYTAGKTEALRKREPIKGGELKVWYSQHTWAMDEQEYTWGFRAYMAGCRDAEKAHGIGVDDETV